MTYAVSKKRKDSPLYPFIVSKKKLTLGVQTAIGPVPLSGSIEVSTQTIATSDSKGLANSQDVCYQKWKATLYKPMPEYIYSPATINYTQFITPPIGSGYTVTTGKQLVQVPYSIFQLQNFIDGRFSGTAPGPSTVQTGVTLTDSIFSLDINKKSTDGVGEAPTTSNVLAKTNHMYLKNVKLDNQWVNSSSNPLMIDIYWCLCMKNSDKSSYDQWIYQLEQERQGQASAQQYTFSNNTPAVGKPSIDTYGEVPTSLKGFNEFWKVIKKEKFILQAGSRCNTMTTLRYNYLASQAIMTAMYDAHQALPSKAPNYIGGFTMVPLVIARGYAILTEQDVQGGAKLYTYSGGRFGFVTKQEYTFVPVSLEDKFPYNRVYNNVFTQNWNPNRESSVVTNMPAVTAPVFQP